MKRLALLTILTLLVCCHGPAGQRQHGDLAEGFDVLDADGREGAYVIAEDPENENYVQFGIIHEKWIHFDFPIFIDKIRDFKTEHEWEIVTESPELPDATRSNFMEAKRAKALWNFLTEEGFQPYYLRSVYTKNGESIASTASICFNVERSERARYLLAASKSFEIIYGYLPPKRLILTSGRTSWSSPTKMPAEQGAAANP